MSIGTTAEVKKEYSYNCMVFIACSKVNLLFSNPLC
jgi:hypothetical protein